MPKIFVGIRVVAPFCPRDMVVRILSHPGMHFGVGGGLRDPWRSTCFDRPVSSLYLQTYNQIAFQMAPLSLVCKGFLRYVT